MQSLLPAKTRLLIGDSSADRVKENGGSEPLFDIEVPTEQVRAGDRVLVLPGESLPVDVSPSPSATHDEKGALLRIEAPPSSCVSDVFEVSIAGFIAGTRAGHQSLIDGVLCDTLDVLKTCITLIVQGSDLHHS